MKIKIDEESYFATVDTTWLAMQGECITRSVFVEYPIVKGTTDYFLRVEMPDMTVYDLQIVNNQVVLTNTITAYAAILPLQWIAKDNTGAIIAKSQIIHAVVKDSIDGDSSALPTPEAFQTKYNECIGEMSSIRDEVRTLKEQIDDGVNPEVTQARVDANGTSYTTLKERLDSTDENVEKIESVSTELKEDLSNSFDVEIVKPINIYDVSKITLNGYLNQSNGNVSVKDTYDFATSDFIDIEPNTSYKALSLMDNSNNSAIINCFYDAEKQFIEKGTELRPYGTVSVTSPSNACYIRICSNINVMTNIQLMLLKNKENPTEYNPYQSEKTLYSVKNNIINPNQTSFIETFKSRNLKGDNLEFGMVRTDNGNIYVSDTDIQAGKGYVHTDYVPVEFGKIYVSSRYGYKAKISSFSAEYDENKNFIGAMPITNMYYYTPLSELVKYIRISYSYVNDFDRGYQFEECESLESEPTQYFRSADSYVFEANTTYPLKNVIWDCIGDSFTDGSPRYHSYISERTGIIVENTGLAGSAVANYSASRSTKSFLDRLGDVNYNADVISIFGGINDARAINNNPSRLGSISDRPTTEEEAITFYGAYRYLIEHIKNNAPKAKLFAIIPPKLHSAVGGNYENSDRYIPQVRTAILELCEEYSIKVVDLYSESGISKMPVDIAMWYRSNTDIHLNNLGQEKISIPIQKTIEWLLD